jgi:hypothetical protein
MSGNVMERIIMSALKYSKCSNDEIPDRWADGSAIKAMMLTAPESGRHLHNWSAAAESSCTRRLIVDSGASGHLVDTASLTAREAATVRRLEDPFQMQTANGIIYAEREAKIRVKELDIAVWAVVLPNTPAVLSLGCLVEEHDLTYIWKKGSPPRLILPTGRVVLCKPSHNVPHIVAGHRK